MPATLRSPLPSPFYPSLPSSPFPSSSSSHFPSSSPFSYPSTCPPFQVTRSPSSLLIAWAVPAANGSPVTGYIVEVTSAGRSGSGSHVVRTTSLPASETQCLVQDLGPDTTYR